MRFFEKKRANADVNETPSKNPNPFSRAEGSRAGHFGRARIIRESHAHLQAALEAAQVLYSIIRPPRPRIAQIPAPRRLRGGASFGFWFRPPPVTTTWGREGSPRAFPLRSSLHG